MQRRTSVKAEARPAASTATTRSRDHRTQARYRPKCRSPSGTPATRTAQSARRPGSRPPRRRHKRRAPCSPEGPAPPHGCGGRDQRARRHRVRTRRPDPPSPIRSAGGRIGSRAARSRSAAAPCGRAPALRLRARGARP